MKGGGNESFDDVYVQVCRDYRPPMDCWDDRKESQVGRGR